MAVEAMRTTRKMGEAESVGEIEGEGEEEDDGSRRRGVREIRSLSWSRKRASVMAMGLWFLIQEW